MVKFNFLVKTGVDPSFNCPSTITSSFGIEVVNVISAFIESYLPSPSVSSRPNPTV